MNMTAPVATSVASGCVWALIGLGVTFIGNQPIITLRQAAFTVAGGFIAAPLIGLLMGAVSRPFGHMPIGTRVLVAGASLYVAVLLFVIASGLFSALWYGRMPRNFWFNCVGIAWASLVWTWFFIVLWPLAYANHALISRLWIRQLSRDAGSIAG
jgi:hypothetical protein